MLFLQGRAVSEPVEVQPGRARGRAAAGVRPGPVRLRQEPARSRQAARSRLQRLSRPFPGQQAGLQGRGAGVPGRELLPRRRQGAELRPLGARPRRRHRGSRRARSSPASSEFWVERPRSNATSLVIHALLDSKRVAGAYRFVVTPGIETTMQVTARFFLREKIAKLGLAPLTSMFAFGENQPGQDDYRPEVHDSDGLSIQGADGEWIWRPLVNPEAPAGHLVHPDQPARLRPDAARPLAGQLRGSGGAVRAPAERLDRAGRQLGARGGSSWCRSRRPDETNDNIVAYWVPQATPVPGKPVDFAYRIRWQSAGNAAHRQGLGGADAAWPRLRQAARRRHQFRRRLRRSAPARAWMAEEAIEPVIWVDANAEVRERNLFRNPVSGAWRMTVRIKRNDPAKPVELRAYLKLQTDNPERDMELHPPGRAGEAEDMTGGAGADLPAAAAAAARRWSARPWAGPLLRRPLRRLLGRGPAPVRPPLDDLRPLRLRRLLLLVLVLLGAWVGTSAMADVLPNKRPGPRGDRPAGPVRHPLRLDLGRLLDRPDGRDRAAARAGQGAAGPRRRRRALLPLDPGVRTAIIMPICNEHVPTVFGGLAATIESLQATGESAAFDVFVLSDSNDPGHPRRRAGRLERPRRPARRRGRRRPAGAAPALPLAAAPDPAQGRQRRRLLPPLGRLPIATSSSSTPTAS